MGLGKIVKSISSFPGFFLKFFFSQRYYHWKTLSKFDFTNDLWYLLGGSNQSEGSRSSTSHFDAQTIFDSYQSGRTIFLGGGVSRDLSFDGVGVFAANQWNLYAVFWKSDRNIDSKQLCGGVSGKACFSVFLPLSSEPTFSMSVSSSCWTKWWIMVIPSQRNPTRWWRWSPHPTF